MRWIGNLPLLILWDFCRGVPALRKGFESLPGVGLALDVDDETASQIVKLVRRGESLGANPELEEKIAQLEDLNLPTKLETAQFAKYLSMSDKQFDELLMIMRECRTHEV